jgi:hypothetical protein
VSQVLSGGLEGPLRKAMSRDPAQRFGSCGELMAALEAGTGAAAVLSESASKGNPSPMLIYAGIGSLLVAMAVAGLLLVRGTGKKTEGAGLLAPPAASGAKVATVTPVPQPGPSGQTNTKKTKAPKVDNNGDLTKPGPFPPTQQGADSSKAQLRQEQLRQEQARQEQARQDKEQARLEKERQEQARKQTKAPPPPPIADKGPGLPVGVITAAKPGYSIAVYSRVPNDPKHQIPNGLTINYRNPQLGEMSSGDLKAVVILNGPPPGKGHFLTLTWLVDGAVVDAKMVSPNTVVELGSEPLAGNYKVTLRLDKETVADYTFRIER